MLFRSGVHAQSAGLEEIVVSARFREENLQKTPVAIFVFLYEHSDLSCLRALSARTPGADRTARPAAV